MEYLPRWNKHKQEETEFWLCQMNSRCRGCRWCCCLSPADMPVRWCHLLWATSWFHRTWRGTTPLFKSKLKTLSFDVQIYRSLLLSLALRLCVSPPTLAHPSSHRAGQGDCIYVWPYATTHRRMASWWPLTAAPVHLGHHCTVSAKRAHATISSVSLVSEHISIKQVIWYHRLMTLHTCLVTVHH